MAERAPYRLDLAEGPEAEAFWLRTSDGVRIRVSHAAAKSSKGTVFILPGRTEYVEKYGRNAADFVRAGFDVVSVDWRGQGMADRLCANIMVGHVERFLDFQKDWSAVRSFANKRGVPKPWYMVAHSMGGCIGLRALMSGTDMTAVMFTGPMWGIEMAAYLRPVAWLVPRLAGLFGQGHRLAPGTSIKSYPASEPFEDNLLTSDPDMYAYMRRHVEAEPQFGLGGPSLTWLRSALEECDALAQMPSPAIPALCFVGSNERIVDTGRIRDRMKYWKGGKLLLVDGAEHEVLMEGANTRRQVTGAAVSLFSSFKA
ncbi:alpha/beta hydrolase [Marivita sp. XM-24bin2]|mgnify:CR=1 FL=1|uniref:alpha/beta fold hydrolase n=1 Tax=unclassified Marivita TaxID=2632480 RepID=UPI000D78E028|nr:alpha/beta hydrolase [Marivita sp. XM-24bin2]MCR9108650.1 alpha/beta hydrolase [Paracoccaceae bacterium]PWL33809.1 MAG: alpha/beta hydrolase [Marivita sp. XM-24bin2]